MGAVGVHVFFLMTQLVVLCAGGAEWKKPGMHGESCDFLTETEGRRSCVNSHFSQLFISAAFLIAGEPGISRSCG